MKQMAQTLCSLCLGLAFLGCQITESRVTEEKTYPRLPSAESTDNSVNPALALVRRDMVQTEGHKSEDFRLIVCTPTETWNWRILAEPLSSTGNDAIYEYAVLKPNGGRISAKRRLLVVRGGKESTVANSSDDAINQEKAVAIATKEGQRVLGSLAEYKLVTCELSKAWRIAYVLEDMTGGGPSYLIDKQTGKILHKLYEQ